MLFTNRVRALLVTNSDKLVLMKRVREGVEPYWVAPGGGVEKTDSDLESALRRELREELAAEVEVLKLLRLEEFQLEEEIFVKQYIFLCHLLNYDPNNATGAELKDGTRGKYIPEEVALNPTVLARLNIKPEDLKAFLVNNAQSLAKLPDLRGYDR